MSELFPQPGALPTCPQIESRPEPPSLLRRKIVAGVMGVVAGLGGAIATESQAADGTPQPWESIPLPAAGTAKECSDVEATFLTMANLLLRQPNNPDHAANVAESNELVDSLSQQEYRNLRSRQDARTQQRAAERYGLTVFDDSQALNKMDFVDQGVVRRTPFASYYQTATEFLDQSDISMHLGSPDGKIPAPKDEELATETAKQDVTAIVDAFGDMPKEYTVGLAGLTDIVLYANPKDGTAAYVYADDALTSHTVYFNLSYKWDKQTPFHEIAHEAHESMCGGLTPMKNDVNFKKLNNDRPYDPHKTAPRGLTYREFMDERAKINNRAYRPGVESSCSLLAKIKTLGEDVYFDSTYARSHPVEDYAETSANDTDSSGYYNMLDPQTPNLRKKHIFTLGRLLKFAPAVAHYFVDTAHRQANYYDGLSPTCSPTGKQPMAD